MIETPRPNPEAIKPSDIDSKKYTDAMHQLFIVLMEFRRVFGSRRRSEYGYARLLANDQYHEVYQNMKTSGANSQQVYSLRNENYGAMHDQLATGTEGEVVANYRGLIAKIKVELLDDIALLRADDMGLNDDPQAFVIHIEAVNELLDATNEPILDLEYEVQIIVGLKSAYAHGSFYAAESSSDQTRSTCRDFLNRFNFQLNLENELTNPKGQPVEFRNALDADQLLRLAQDLRMFIDDRDSEYTVLQTTHDQGDVNERR